MIQFLLPALIGTLVLIAPQALTDTTRLRWVPNPRARYGGWVADPAHHLSGTTVITIDSTLSALDREKGVEIAVVVIDSLDGLEPSAAALLLHRRWGVGKGARDNGIVFLWSPALRQTFVSVGYGLEGVIPDAVAGRIQDQWVIPAFRAGDFNGGILGGVNALVATARTETYSGPPRARVGGSATQPRRHMPLTVNGRNVSPETEPRLYYGVMAAIVTVGVLLLSPWAALLLSPFLFVAWRLRRYVPHRCPNGHGWMHRLSETEDDAMLDEGERLEEKLASVDYDVWVCNDCDYRLVIPRRKFFTKFKECPQCKRKTLETDRTTIVAATYSSEGSALVKRTCRNCKFHDEITEAIPVLTMSSSGGSGSSGGGGSSGGSFGGGSSGGGGAGRSY